MASPLNILMISHHRRYRAFARPHAFASHLVRRGHSVTLVVTSDHRRVGTCISEWDGVKIVEAPDLLSGRLRSGWDPWDTLHRIGYLHKDLCQFDLVHCFETRPATIYPALDYVRRCPVPLLTDWNDWYGRGGIIDTLRPWWYRLLFTKMETYYEEAFRARGAGLTAISTALAERAEGLGVPRERICVLSGGAFLNKFPMRPMQECRERVGLPQDIPIFGFSSTDSHLDFGMVRDAMLLLRQRYPNLCLMITGRPSRELLYEVDQSGLGNNVLLTGFLPFDELAVHLGCANLFLLPFPDKVYNRGRWPNKMGDYMCLGRPTVSNPVGDIAPLFARHQVGLLAEETSEDFAAKISLLLEDPALAARLGENARRTAVEHYDWNVLIEKLEIFYRKILTQERVVGSQIEAIRSLPAVPAERRKTSLYGQIKLMLKRWLNPGEKRSFKRWTARVARWFNLRRKLPAVQLPFTPPEDHSLKAGDLVRVRPLEEIRPTLTIWKDLKGCPFMAEMEPYCGTVQRVYKPVRQFLDERDYRLKRTSGIYLLEGVICEGTELYGACDRSCFFFWREEWLEKVNPEEKESVPALEGALRR